MYGWDMSKFLKKFTNKVYIISNVPTGNNNGATST